jgi:hypothetical protein
LVFKMIVATSGGDISRISNNLLTRYLFRSGL